MRVCDSVCVVDGVEHVRLLHNQIRGAKGGDGVNRVARIGRDTDAWLYLLYCNSTTGCLDVSATWEGWDVE